MAGAAVGTASAGAAVVGGDEAGSGCFLFAGSSLPNRSSWPGSCANSGSFGSEGGGVSFFCSSVAVSSTGFLFETQELQRRVDCARCVLDIASSPHISPHAWHCHAVVLLPRPPLFFAGCNAFAIAADDG